MISSAKKYRGLKFLPVLAFILVACAVAIAEENVNVREEKEVLTTLQQRMLKLVSIDVTEVPIETVVRQLAEQADVDFILSPKVTGTVTFKLTDVPLEEALSNILTAHGYDYVTSKNMVRIAPVGEIAAGAERLVSRIYRITYADVEEVEKALNKFKSPRGAISSNPGTSNVIVTDTERKIKAIDTFIKEIDRITPQILVEVRIYDITSREKLDLGIEWYAGRRTDTIFSAVGTNPTSGPRNPFVTSGFTNPTSKTGKDITGALRLGWLNAHVDVDIMLRAQQENVDAKLLANPRILVLDNERAFFNIVTEHPYVERTITGSTVTETVKFKEVGIKLEVTPHVTRDGMLRLHIAPEFGIFVERVTVAASDVPVVDTRKINTIALVEDGQTVVLGGLRKKDVSTQINKIPLLGDLPLIGALFRFEGEDTANTELVIFITPRIVERPVMSQAEKRAFEVTEFSGPEPVITKAEVEASKK